MSDQLITDELRQIVREEVAAAVKTALADIPTRAEMQSYVNAQLSETNGLIRSMDDHLRRAEYSSGETHKSVDRIAEVVNNMAQTVKTVAQRQDELRSEVSEHTEQITDVRNRTDRTHAAIFGDPSTPGVISLAENVSNWRQESRQGREDTKAEIIAANVAITNLGGTISGRIEPLEQYVTSRRLFEARIVKTIQLAIRYRYAVIFVFSLIGGGVAVGSIDQLLQFLGNLVDTLSRSGQ